MSIPNQQKPNMEETSKRKAKIVGRLQTIKQNSGKTHNQIAEETGLTNVYVAQLLKRQAQLKPETAAKLRTALPDLPEELLDEMMKAPLRSYDPNLIQDPTVYRFFFLHNSYKIWTKEDFF